MLFVCMQYFKKHQKPVVEFEWFGALINPTSTSNNDVSQSFFCGYNKPFKNVVCDGKIRPR